MRGNHLLLLLSAAMLIFLQSCNFPRPTPTGQQGAATATSVALTQQAGGIPVTGGTGTPAQPILSAQTSLDCRMGPGSAYPLVATINPGSGFLVIGRYTAGNFWVIANPTGGSCWVSSRKTIVAGDTSRLPEYPAPPKATATPSPTEAATATSVSGSLPAPANLKASRVCGKGFHGKTPIWIEGVVLTWQPSTGQEGYRVYHNGQLVAPLPADATLENVQITYPRSANGQPDSFGVEAYNGSATSVRATVNVPRCP